MYLTCIVKELLLNIKSMRYALTFFLFLLLTTSSVMVRTHLYKKQKEDYRKAVVERMRNMEMVERFWQSSGLGITVEKMPNPLAIFAAGLENEMTRSFSLSGWRAPTTGWRKLRNPSFKYFLQLDMVLVINIVCSLLALLLVFDGINGERENGTLKVMLSGPLPRDVVIVAKMAAGLITILVPLLISWVVALIYVTVIGRVQLGAEHITRLARVVALSVVYISFFFALGIAASCWTRRSATSLAVCLFAWVVVVLAVPNLVPMAVKHFAPIPPQSKIMVEKDGIMKTIEEEMEPGWREELVNTGKFKGIQDLMAEIDRLKTEEFNKRVAKINRFYNSRIRRQLSLNQRISRVSPSASFVFAATHMAGVGVQDFLSLLADVNTFQRNFLDVKARQEHERREREEREKNRKRDPDEKKIDAYDPKRWPTFEPRRISAAAVLNDCWIDVVLLCGATGILFLSAFVGFMRYDVR